MAMSQHEHHQQLACQSDFFSLWQHLDAPCSGLHNLNTANTILSCSAIASMTWYLHRTTANSPQLCRHQHDSIASSPAWLSIYIVSPPSCPGSDVACMTQQHHHQHDSTYTSLLVFLSHRIIYKRTDANCSLHPRVFQCIESIGKQ
jgi:hypothetical protein